jgi:hypothetical protein
MKKNNDPLDRLFDHLENQWDIQDLPIMHQNRFLEKQKKRNKTTQKWFALSIAASILIILGLFVMRNQNQPQKDFKLASAETQKTDSVFNAIIQKELTQIKQKKTTLNDKILTDALFQMNEMEKDYEKIKKELIENGENKQIIYAMIQNFKTRIAFLENVLEQINNIEKLNTTTDENTI